MLQEISFKSAKCYADAKMCTIAGTQLQKYPNKNCKANYRHLIFFSPTAELLLVANCIQ